MNFAETRHLIKRGRLGASEVLGALIIAMITIAAFTAYAGNLLNQTKSETTSITEALRKGIIKQGQLLTPLYHWENVEGTQTRIEVSIYNYGYSEVKPSFIFIDARPQDNYRLTDLDGNPVQAIKPGETTKIVAVAPYVVQGVLSGKGYELALFGADSIAYVWWL
ncbi:MAG: hypothetical protein HY619_04175 [Thaumarchaeota archaeon]|nr:hypothetical protein [Nitrososphaerota archaeon]